MCCGDVLISRKTFKEEFFQGERVQIQVDDINDSVEKIEGLVRDKASFPEMRAPNGTIERPAITRYFVTIDMDPQKEALVDNKHVFRERKLFNRSIIRSFLKHTITRERWEGAPWLVKEDIARQYRIDTAIPTSLQYENVMAERKAHLALKRGRPDEQCLEFFQGEIPGLVQATKAYKGKLPHDLVMHFQDALAGKISPSAVKSGYFPNGPVPFADLSRKVQVVIPPPPPPVTVKYPIEDLEIYPRRNFVHRPELKYLPSANSDTESSASNDDFQRLNKTSVGSLLEIWNTLNVHCELFILDSFTLDDFVEAMLLRLDNVECELFTEVHCAVLKLLVDEKGNVDSSIPSPAIMDEDAQQSSADTSLASTPAPEIPSHQSQRIKRSSMLRNDITNDLKTHSIDLAAQEVPQNSAEEMLGSRDWITRLTERDFTAGGWQTIVVGLLHHLTLCLGQTDVIHHILAHLAPTDHIPCQETARRQYTSLDVNLKIAALEAILMLAITSRSLKDSMDSRMSLMTDMRKDRQTWQREKKSLIEDIHALDEQRRTLYPETNGLPEEVVANGVSATSNAAHNHVNEDNSEPATSDSEDEGPHKGRRRISSRANDLKRKREQEEEVRREKEKKAKLENSVTAQYKSLTREIQKKEKEIISCEDQVAAFEEKLRVSTCHRTKELGRDRFWNRYYWFERNGMPFAGYETSSTASKGYANGRIWVQGPDDIERAGFIDLPPDEASQYALHFGMSVQRRQELEVGSTLLRTATDFGYYDTPEALDKLIGWLDDRGHREKALRKELQKWRDKIVEQMDAMNTYLAEVAEKKASSEEPIIGIATRKKTYVDHNATKYPCLAWTNSAAKRELGQLHSEGLLKKVAKVSRGKTQSAVVEKPTTRQSTRLR